MILRVALVILGCLFAMPLLAQPVRVTSGDHPDFTRIVLEFAGPVDWTMGRTADGYELRLTGDPAQFDLSKVFDLIPKDRLAAIWADPGTGNLHFTIGCACFAMPFEFRPGTVVIDIRTGPPPKGSSFELALDGAAAENLQSRPVIRPQKRPFPTTAAMAEPEPAVPKPVYDWTATLMDPKPAATGPNPGDLIFDAAVTQTATLDLAPLRQSLIEQLSRGASQGIVDMARPRKSEPNGDQGGNPSVAIRLGDADNLVIRQKGEVGAPLTAAGAECIPDEALDIAAWAAETPVVEQIGPIMSGLVGEFDKPNDEAVRNAIRFYLNLGFGAEARSLIRAFSMDEKENAIWTSMAHILDAERDPDSAFAGMAGCETAAALWAALADDAAPAVGQVERAAILRTFSALPSHLRRQLGPTLVDRFLGMQDFATAITLRDAVLRGTAEHGPEIQLMQAAIARADGAPSASEALLTDVATESGPKSAEALAALVVQRAEMGQDVSFEQVQALEEYASEREGSANHAVFNHALTIGYGASGDFETAFGRLAETPDAAPLLWQILGSSGPDSALLAIATLNERQQPPPAAIGAASLITTRMLKLGFADQAASWLGLAKSPPDLLTARVRLAEGRPQVALDLVGGDTSPGGFALRVQALQALGDDRAVADLFAQSGMTDEQWSTISRMQDWETLADGGPEVWKMAAEQLVGPPPVAEGASEPGAGSLPPGPLATGQDLLVSSAGTRDAITALLDTVKSPALPTQ